MVKLINTLTDLKGPDHAATELIRALNTLKCDVEGGMARFLVEWYLSCDFNKDASVCKDFSPILTVNGPHPGLCQAFIQAKLQEKMVPGAGRQQKLPSPLASHPAHRQSDFSIESVPQKHSEPATSVQSQTANTELHVQKGKDAWKYKTDVNVELLRYVERPEEDFTNMTGAERNLVRLRLRRRMLKAKGFEDSKSRWLDQEEHSPTDKGSFPPADDNDDSDSESIAVAATPLRDPTTRSTRASLRKR